jgi:hypothetical protein
VALREAHLLLRGDNAIALGTRGGPYSSGEHGNILSPIGPFGLDPHLVWEIMNLTAMTELAMVSLMEVFEPFRGVTPA